MHRYQDLIFIFNRCFSKTYNTKLVKGNDEPIYRPANDQQRYNTIYFAHGFFSSALHECSHWLIAGFKRRQQEDFGYWYEPDGRTQAQQALFQSVEIQPQALEWILSVATGYQFRVSIDNLSGIATDIHSFKNTIYQQVIHYCHHGLSKRATYFRDALCHFYKTPSQLSTEMFSPLDLD